MNKFFTPSLRALAPMRQKAPLLRGPAGGEAISAAKARLLRSLRSLAMTVFLGSAIQQGVFAAEPASANYQMTDSYFPGASGNGASGNYKADESTVDYFDKATAGSANYSIQGTVGIRGVENIPVINSTDPSGYARFFSDENASYTVSATPMDGDIPQYRAKQDGTVKAGPQPSSVLSWALGASDLGRRVHSLEVIDPDGTVVKAQAAYILRRPVK